MPLAHAGSSDHSIVTRNYWVRKMMDKKGDFLSAERVCALPMRLADDSRHQNSRFAIGMACALAEHEPI